MPSNTERSESSREELQPGMLPTSIHLVACFPTAECESEWKTEPESCSIVEVEPSPFSGLGRPSAGMAT